MEHNLRYFLGASTQNGFFNTFEGMSAQKSFNRLFIVKGGPGTGKSTLFKRLMKYYEEKGEPTEKFYCSSDTKSLDGIYNPLRKIAFVDGTAPHEMSPKMPGAYETVIELSSGFDTKFLQKNRRQIALLSGEIAAWHSRAKKYMTAAKLIKTAVRETAAQYLAPSLKNRSGVYADFNSLPQNISVRFVSAIANKKCVFYDDVINTCQNTVALCDSYGAAANSVINRFLNASLLSGERAILCPCPLTFLPEHIILPQSNTAITVKNKFHGAKSCITIENELLYKGMPQSTAAALDSQINLAARLIKTACECKQEAYLLHTKLEEYYKTATDFSAAEEAFEKYKDAK